MAKKPLLIFPRRVVADRTMRGQSVVPRPILPGLQNQVQRLDQQVSQLEASLRNRTAYLANQPGNFVAEMIIVFEIAGSIDDFFKAVEATPGMDFLIEHKSDFAADQFFAHQDGQGRRLESRVDARLFFTMTNQRAIRELLTYWEDYRNQRRFRHGRSRFRLLFEQLRDLRPYGIEDRLKDTGILEDIEYLRLHGYEEAYFEVELAYKDNGDRNLLAFTEVDALLRQHGGMALVESRTLIPEINYHAFIARAPINSFDDITENTQITFLKSQQILFFRPVGQSISIPPDGEGLEGQADRVAEFDMVGEPLVALFDGLPLENHQYLQNRLVIDDPDGFAQNYPVNNRRHGSAMASLIIHGDLSDETQVPYARPIYVRPIMVPFGDRS